ncbi:hypothetical protein [Mycobacterium sp. shizuoka-1]|uniref:hypothetical protein n=1 Tax=Mycobacterium sp. shizuoka-1 TaxID=2039281 RepID=UPI0013042233|nr:hypothetical protein [Mycobacterium sp. shizuoka-1]
MHIDHTRRDDLSGRIDDPGRRCIAQSTDPGDPAVANRNVGELARCVRSVNQGATLDDYVIVVSSHSHVLLFS